MWTPRDCTFKNQRICAQVLIGDIEKGGHYCSKGVTRGLLDCLYSNPTLETLISKSTFGIAKILDPTLNILTPLYGPYYRKQCITAHHTKVQVC